MATTVLNESGWERWHDWQARVMQPVIDWFVSVIDPRPGHRILDAACGTGLPALALAARVGNAGRVIAGDISPAMVGAVGRMAVAAGLANIDPRVLDVARLELPDGELDAATCKDGVIYCADPVVATRELYRVLRTGGRVAVTAWDEPAKNPFFTTLFGTVARFVALPAPQPSAPGPFRLAQPGALEHAVRAAGFSEVTVERREVGFAFESFEHYVAATSDLAAPMQLAARTLDPESRARLHAALRDALAPFTASDGAIRIPNVVVCATGRRA